jgi:IPT/TIG domain-containing protein
VATAVTITGSNLMGATVVSFNGTNAAFTVASSTQIAATVPNGATTGKISVTTPGGSASSTPSFTVTLAVPAPTISSLAPTSGQVGTAVTITGTNLTGATAVAFNGKAASFTVNSATQITTSVPSGATTGKVTVTTPGGNASSAGNFTVSTSSTTLDLTIDGLYVSQATQDYPNPAVPLVQGRSGWVRVFAKANQTNNVAPQVRVQFINGGTTNTLTINATGASVPTTIDPDSDLSWDAAVPSAWIQPGAQVVAMVDPSGVIPESNKNNNQFSQTLDVRTLKPWKITLIPVHTGDGRTGTVLNSNRTQNDWVDFAKRLHPVPDAVDVTTGTTMNSSVASLSSNGTGWSTVLTELSAKRSADGVTDRYYYGVVNVGYTSGVAGLGYIGFPAAMGWDYSSGAAVLAHEIGHNFGRQHSPCGGAGNPDPNYPYPGGIIGVPGWDAFTTSNNLKTSADHTDIMGYCSNQWVSDYVYISVLNFRLSSPIGLVASDVVGGNSQQEGLLVWGRIENNQVILEPAFRVPVTGTAPQAGPYTWEARDTFGRVLATVPFDAPEVADLPNTSLRIFSFVVPMTSESSAAVNSVRLSKGNQELARAVHTGPEVHALGPAPVALQDLPNGRVQLTWNAGQYPVLMLRDAGTGEVRGFLRGGSAAIQDPPQEMEIQFSDGVRSGLMRYQRPLK